MQKQSFYSSSGASKYDNWDVYGSWSWEGDPWTKWHNQRAPPTGWKIADARGRLTRADAEYKLRQRDWSWNVHSVISLEEEVAKKPSDGVKAVVWMDDDRGEYDNDFWETWMLRNPNHTG